MFNIQEIVDNLLIPEKFPPPTFCRYFGSDFPASLQQALEPSMYSLGLKKWSYVNIEWRSNKFRSPYRDSDNGDSEIYQSYLGILIDKHNINIYMNPMEERFFGENLKYTNADKWQNFVSTELPKWFNLANELVPMKLFKDA